MKGTLAVAFIAILFLSMFSALALKVNAQQSSVDWPMFRANPSHTGAGTGSPVLAPTLLWNYTTTGDVYSSPAVVNGVVYIGSDDSNVYALNATSGAKLWNYTTGGGVFMSPAVVDGRVYVGGGTDIYALNATNGDKLWNYTTNGLQSSPAVEGGVVYGGNIAALNGTDGVKLWNYAAYNISTSSPAVVNGVVYVGNGNNVYALGALSSSSLSSKSDALFIIVGVVAAVVIVAAMVVLMFRKRLKTKQTSPPSTQQNSSSVSTVQIFLV